MSAPTSPPWMRGYTRWTGQPRPDLRISDSDRTQATDRLSKHYGDGRLDEEEFSKRLDQAMNAKTHADLDGLFADLPGPEAGDPARAQLQKPPGQHWHPVRRIALLAVVILLTVAVAHSLVHWFFPLTWLLIAVLVLLWLRSPARRRRL
jgi:Flp pilus assembly protein TadB